MLRTRFLRWLGGVEEEEVTNLYHQNIILGDELAVLADVLDESVEKLVDLEKDATMGFQNTLKYIKDAEKFRAIVSLKLGLEKDKNAVVSESDVGEMFG